MEISNNGNLNEQIKFFCQPSYCSICESIQWLFGCLSSNLKRIITHKMINYQVVHQYISSPSPYKLHVADTNWVQAAGGGGPHPWHLPGPGHPLVTSHWPPAPGLPWPWLLSPGLCSMQHVGIIHWIYGPACTASRFTSQHLGFTYTLYIYI